MATKFASLPRTPPPAGSAPTEATRAAAGIAEELVGALTRLIESSQASQLRVMEQIQAQMNALASSLNVRPLTKEASDTRTLTRRDAMLQKLDASPAATANGYAALLSKGEAARVAWTKDGSLIPSTALAKSWGLTRQGLAEAEGRHELFFVKVGNRLWTPAAFTVLPRVAVKAVCVEMPEADPESQFLFWMRTHGGLGPSDKEGRARTVAEAIQAGQLARVVEIARGLAEENGWAHAGQTA